MESEKLREKDKLTPDLMFRDPMGAFALALYSAGKSYRRMRRRWTSKPCWDGSRLRRSCRQIETEKYAKHANHLVWCSRRRGMKLFSPISCFSR